MRFDIVPQNRVYSGIDRSIMPENFLTSDTKPYYKTLLDVFYNYLDLTCSPNTSLDYDEKMFSAIKEYYREFCAYKVSCEIIAYDTAPIDSVFGTPVELLGIDIVCDEMAESLLSYNQKDNTVRRYLNENGLFDNPADANNVIDLLDRGKANWNLCWVYKVVC